MPKPKVLKGEAQRMDKLLLPQKGVSHLRNGHGATVVAERLTARVTPAEDLGSVPSTHIVAQNLL